ncbi:MAG TPA: FAD-binding dehydrogenase, partial [Longimicrobiales bacterium]|nr:FAD-binding dehydrogenase [Longimicrobiales bacterium]
MSDQADAIIVGAGLAGLAAAGELADAGRRVVVVDQESEANLGGQAWWSFGGLFLVDSPEQRRMRIRDSRELAWQDWLGTAGFDRPEDRWPRAWAEAYVDFAHREKRSWLHAMGVRFFPVVGWAERGGGLAGGHGNSVPRFHVVWGTGPGLVEPFAARARGAEADGRLAFRFRHRVTGLLRDGDRVRGVRGEVLEEDDAPRGAPTSRTVVDEFELRAPAVIVSSGGIGADQTRVRRQWPVERVGPAPERMLSGVPDHVDGAMLDVVTEAGGSLIHPDRMWHYCEGIENWDPIWTGHGIRILPGPSSLWLDAEGNRLPVPCLPGFDTLSTLEHIVRTGHAYSWFILTQRIIEKEFALSGSEQNPDLTGRSIRGLLGRLGPGAPGPVEAFKDQGVDFVVERDLDQLVAGMNRIA